MKFFIYEYNPFFYSFLVINLKQIKSCLEGLYKCNGILVKALLSYTPDVWRIKYLYFFNYISSINFIP